MNQGEIAQTILDQIKAMDRVALMAWGARNFIALPEMKMGEELQIGGVQFRVSGAKFQGLIIVRLMANDTYRVETGRVVKTEWKQKDFVKEVYCEDLMRIIDGLVER